MNPNSSLDSNHKQMVDPEEEIIDPNYLLDVTNPESIYHPHKYYDNHTLFVRSGVGTNEQLKKCVEQTIRRFDPNIKCEIIPNIIIGRDNRYYGFGYIYVSNSQVYNLLIGKNLDGTERVQHVPDPKWKPPVKPLQTALSEINITETGWGDVAEAEEIIMEQYNCPTISHKLDPLVRLDKYTLTRQQKDLIKNLMIENDIHGLIPDMGTFEFQPAYVVDIEDEYSGHVLCCRSVPNGITIRDIKNIFIPFTSNTKFVIERKIHGKFVRDTYPFVTINEKRMAFIMFDPTTRDAQFALLMTKKYNFISERNECYTLMFGHSYK